MTADGGQSLSCMGRLQLQSGTVSTQQAPELLTWSRVSGADAGSAQSVRPASLPRPPCIPTAPGTVNKKSCRIQAMVAGAKRLQLRDAKTSSQSTSPTLAFACGPWLQGWELCLETGG